MQLIVFFKVSNGPQMQMVSSLSTAGIGTGEPLFLELLIIRYSIYCFLLCVCGKASQVTSFSVLHGTSLSGVNVIDNVT